MSALSGSLLFAVSFAAVHAARQIVGVVGTLVGDVGNMLDALEGGFVAGYMGRPFPSPTAFGEVNASDLHGLRPIWVRAGSGVTAGVTLGIRRTAEGSTEVRVARLDNNHGDVGWVPLVDVALRGDA